MDAPSLPAGYRTLTLSAALAAGMLTLPLHAGEGSSGAETRFSADESASLANGLWSSAGVVQDFSSAVLHRPCLNGGRQVWGMGIGSFARMSSQHGSPGCDVRAGGYALGAETCVERHPGLGFAFGQLGGENQLADGMNRMRQNSLMASLYGRYDSHAGEKGRRTLLEASATYGRTHHRGTWFGQGAGRSRARWSDELLSLELRASWERPLTERASLFPFIGLRYLHAAHGAFSVASGVSSRSYSSASLQNLSVPLGVTLRSRYEPTFGQALLPELSLGYEWDVSRRNPHQGASGEAVRSSGAAPGRRAFLLRAGVAWELGRHWGTSVYYCAGWRRHEFSQALNVGVAYAF